MKDHSGFQDIESIAPIIKLMSRMGALAALIIAVAIPVIYYNATTTEIRHGLALETAFLAKSIEKIVQARPDMWEFEITRLAELISEVSIDGRRDEKEIRTFTGTMVVKTDFAVPRPYTMISKTFFDSGMPTGLITARRSIRTQVIATVLLGLLSFSLGCFIYFIFRTYPIRILCRTFVELHLEKEKFEKTLQAIGDGIISVDPNGEVQFINRMAERLIGMDVSQAVGCSFEGVYAPRRIVNGRREDGDLSILVDNHGNEHLIEETRTSINEGKNSGTGTVVIIKDVSGRDKAEEIHRHYEASIKQLRKVLGATVNAIVAIVETRDPYTAGHQRRVADLARCIATAMSLTADQIDSIRIAASIHDIGKISIPAEILSKPVKLKKTEFEIIKEHPVAGYKILKDIDFPWPIARMVLEHHERIDGSGYPNGLTGDQLLVESKIIAVADVVEAIASHRPYRPALGIYFALEEILNNKGILYDPVVVDACIRLFGEGGYKMKCY